MLSSSWRQILRETGFKVRNKAKYLELDLVSSILTIRVQFIYVYSSTYYVISLVFFFFLLFLRVEYIICTRLKGHVVEEGD